MPETLNMNDNAAGIEEDTFGKRTEFTIQHHAMTLAQQRHRSTNLRTDSTPWQCRRESHPLKTETVTCSHLHTLSALVLWAIFYTRTRLGNYETTHSKKSEISQLHDLFIVISYTIKYYNYVSNTWKSFVCVNILLI